MIIEISAIIPFVSFNDFMEDVEAEIRRKFHQRCRKNYEKIYILCAVFPVAYQTWKFSLWVMNRENVSLITASIKQAHTRLRVGPCLNIMFYTLTNTDPWGACWPVCSCVVTISSHFYEHIPSHEGGVREKGRGVRRGQHPQWEISHHK